MEAANEFRACFGVRPYEEVTPLQFAHRLEVIQNDIARLQSYPEGLWSRDMTENPYDGVPHWQEACALLNSMKLIHAMSSDPSGISILGGVYLGTAEEVAAMTDKDVNRKIEIYVAKYLTKW